MIFIDNKYSKYYYNIINAARSRNIHSSIYTEIHHIVPKCLAGSDESSNLVKLTPREHFICHLLLTKMVQGRAIHKMKFAFGMMLVDNRGFRYKPSARYYELRRKLVAEAASQTNKGKVPWNKGKRHSAETRAKMSSAIKAAMADDILRAHLSEKRKQRITKDSTRAKMSVARSGINNSMYGKKHTEETKQKQREAKKNTATKICEYCGKIVVVMSYKRWHGAKCKNAPKKNPAVYAGLNSNSC